VYTYDDFRWNETNEVENIQVLNSIISFQFQLRKDENLKTDQISGPTKGSSSATSFIYFIDRLLKTKTFNFSSVSENSQLYQISIKLSTFLFVHASLYPQGLMFQKESSDVNSKK
jgi:hypothetical protein